VTNIRPGFIVGPGDPTDRFTYWPIRVARGDEVLAPGSGADHLQFIDVRDLANWIVHCLEQNIVGTFNAHLGARQLTMGEMLGVSRNLLNESAEFTWIDSSILEKQNVIPQVDMPIWLPGGMELSSDRAQRKGLKFLPISETIRDTHGWFTSLPLDRQAALRSGISAEREAAVLRAWHNETGV
jgi:2'-hydroxyisoflavone reductase